MSYDHKKSPEKIIRGKDDKGYFWQYGPNKYYSEDPEDRLPYIKAFNDFYHVNDCLPNPGYDIVWEL